MGITDNKTLVNNSVSKIKGKRFYRMEIRSYDGKPAHLGSRGCERCKLDNNWSEGPKWL